MGDQVVPVWTPPGEVQEASEEEQQLTSADSSLLLDLQEVTEGVLQQLADDSFSNTIQDVTANIDEWTSLQLQPLSPIVHPTVPESEREQRDTITATSGPRSSTPRDIVPHLSSVFWHLTTADDDSGVYEDTGPVAPAIPAAASLTHGSSEMKVSLVSMITLPNQLDTSSVAVSAMVKTEPVNLNADRRNGGVTLTKQEAITLTSDSLPTLQQIVSVPKVELQFAECESIDADLHVSDAEAVAVMPDSKSATLVTESTLVQADLVLGGVQQTMWNEHSLEPVVVPHTEPLMREVGPRQQFHETLEVGQWHRSRPSVVSCGFGVTHTAGSFAESRPIPVVVAKLTVVLTRFDVKRFLQLQRARLAARIRRAAKRLKRAQLLINLKRRKQLKRRYTT